MTFKISKTSQSYRFLIRYNDKFKSAMNDYNEDGWMGSYLPRTFCDYYRLVFKTAAVVFGAGLCIAMIPFFWLIITDNGGAFQNPPLWQIIFILPLFLAGLLGSFAVAGITLYGFAYGVVHYIIPPVGNAYEHIAAKFRSDEPKQHQPSALSTWIKAKKEKYCPLVEFEK